MHPHNEPRGMPDYKRIIDTCMRSTYLLMRGHIKVMHDRRLKDVESISLRIPSAGDAL